MKFRNVEQTLYQMSMSHVVEIDPCRVIAFETQQ